MMLLPTLVFSAMTAAAGRRTGHSASEADIVIATEADYLQYNYIRDGMLGGFDIELTQGVCKAAGKTCAIVTVPWQSVWPKTYLELGWESNPKTYPGIGTNNNWYHCTSGTRNTIARSQSTIFTGLPLSLELELYSSSSSLLSRTGGY